MYFNMYLCFYIGCIDVQKLPEEDYDRSKQVRIMKKICVEM